MMTEEERREAFWDRSNWYASQRFPMNEAFKVLAFEFYSVTIYELQMYTTLTWKSPFWTHDKFFIEDHAPDGELGFAEVTRSEIFRMMRAAEEKEEAS